MNQEELDALLQVIENPVRRRIIKRLSQQPSYALQLSKELGLGQPLVAKHMGLMESAGLVTSTVESSPSGPQRRRYSLAKSFSITMDLAPNLFLERGMAFEAQSSKARRSRATEPLRRRVETAAQVQNDRERLSILSRVLNDVDTKMGEIDADRADLLSIRDDAMREAAKIASKLEGPDKRRVLFHILDSHDMQVESISESLNIRELSVRTILEELEREYLG